MKLKRFPRFIQVFLTALTLLASSLALSACFRDQTYDTYYGRVIVPREQQFRWIDGTLPQTVDPAFAAAPPDTDLVRAIFEGLTDYDPRTLEPVPAVAKRWESANDGRTWTFYLREEARWSNGEAVVAKDFVESWRRTMRIGDLAPHTDLLSNIVGAAGVSVPAVPTRNGNARTKREAPEITPSERADARFGAEAVAEYVLRVRLQIPDLNFPALVAHPVFRPIKVAPDNSLKRIDASGLVSNGAFLLTKQDANRVLLQRADNYWAKNEVNLERVEFVGAINAEAALAAYQAGEVDAVTNSAFAPLALKLLAPYQDFRREIYGALTYYSFNLAHEPFDDVRVREALAIAIDRERLSQDEMGGATEPAKKFLPELKTQSKAVVSKTELLERDAERARTLLAEAGYPDGRGFPVVRLLINRNEQQRLIANSIAAMWRSILNIETEISIKGWDEYEMAIRAGDYDVVRRGMVMQTTDELTNIRAIFQQDNQPVDSLTAGQTGAPASGGGGAKSTPEPPRTSPIESESDALKELRAIPLYFASSHALVKPYVTGFDSNLLDVPSLRRVRIDTNWTAQKEATGGR